MLYITVLGLSFIIVLYFLYQKSITTDVNIEAETRRKEDNKIDLQPKKKVATAENTKKKNQTKKNSNKYIEPEDTEFEAAITKQVEDFNKQTKVANKEEGDRDRSKYKNKDT